MHSYLPFQKTAKSQQVEKMMPVLSFLGTFPENTETENVQKQTEHKLFQMMNTKANKQHVLTSSINWIIRGKQNEAGFLCDGFNRRKPHLITDHYMRHSVYKRIKLSFTDMFL